MLLLNTLKCVHVKKENSMTTLAERNPEIGSQPVNKHT